METVPWRIRMHDPLLEEDPWGLSLQEKSYAESFAEGQLLMGRKLLLIFVQIKFSRLTELAEAWS